MDNSWCHFSTSYKALSQVPELRILVTISGHINMNIPVHRPIKPVSLLILMRQFRIQSECQYYNQPCQAAANGAASDIEWSLMAESRSALYYEEIKRGNAKLTLQNWKTQSYSQSSNTAQKPPASPCRRLS